MWGGCRIVIPDETSTTASVLFSVCCVRPTPCLSALQFQSILSVPKITRWCLPNKRINLSYLRWFYPTRQINHGILFRRCFPHIIRLYARSIVQFLWWFWQITSVTLDPNDRFSVSSWEFEGNYGEIHEYRYIIVVLVPLYFINTCWI